MIATSLGMIAHGYHFLVESSIVRRASDMGILMPTGFVRVHLFLVAVFLLAAFGSALGKTKGVLVSLLGLTGIFVGYVAWYLFSARILRSLIIDLAQHPENLPPSIFGLFRAKWWDPVILLLCVMIFVWQVITLVRVLKQQRYEID